MVLALEPRSLSQQAQSRADEGARGGGRSGEGRHLEAALAALAFAEVGEGVVLVLDGAEEGWAKDGREHLVELGVDDERPDEAGGAELALSVEAAGDLDKGPRVGRALLREERGGFSLCNSAEARRNAQKGWLNLGTILLAGGLGGLWWFANQQFRDGK